LLKSRHTLAVKLTARSGTSMISTQSITFREPGKSHN
jgi:hypothetical protein